MAETMTGTPPYTPDSRPPEEEEEMDDSIEVDLTPGYMPSYSPEEPPDDLPSYAPGERGYSPYAPEAVDYEALAIEAIRGVIDRSNQRANERYGGSRLGRVRQFFRREGSRNDAETLEQIGDWQKNPKWKKWALLGAKVAGGVGVATAMVATGGAGAILTPMLWSAGAREAYDGTMEAVEELGWGRKRSGAELGVQAVLSQRIIALKEGVQSEDINDARFTQLLGQMLEAENAVIETEQTNFKGERKGKLIRSIASTVLTVGTGLVAGVPLGTHDYDKGATKVGNVVLDKAHRVMWNLRGGGQFLYNSPAELTNVATEAVKHGYNLTLHGVSGVDTYRQIGHVLGHGLPVAEKVGLAAAGAYNLARNVIDFMKGRKPIAPEPEPYAPGYSPSYSPSYGPSSPAYGSSEEPSYGSSDSPDSPDGAGEVAMAEPAAESHTSVDIEAEKESERVVVETYLDSLTTEKKAELLGLGEGVSGMSERCKYAVCIPASYAEHAVIYHTLEQYLDQKDMDGEPLAPEEFEINIYVNGPDDKREDIERTVGEIDRFKQDHPELRVNCVSKTFGERATIGALRKDLTDLTLTRSQNRENSDNSLCVISNDADVEKIDSQYFARAGQVFQQNPELKMFVGKDDFPEKEYQAYPYLLAARRLWQFTDIVMRNRKYSDFLPKTVGLNSFIRAQSYAEAGGYRPEDWVAEDLNLARDVAAKHGGRSIGRKNIPVVTSPRRDMAMIEKGVPLVHAYNDFGNVESFRETPPRPVALESLVPGNPEFKKRLNKEASAVFNDLYNRFFWVSFDRNPEVRQRRTEQGREADVSDLIDKLRKDPRYGGESARKAGKAFRRTMEFWGAEYTLAEDQHGSFRVKITDMSKLQEGLAQHQA